MSHPTEASLLLVAHGSSRYPAAAEDLARLAALIRARGAFAHVDIAFWRQEPFLSPDQLRPHRVFVLPFFAGLGKHTEELIPQKLGLTGAVTRRDGREIVYCAPVGCHPAMPHLIHQRALALCRANDLSMAAVALLLIGHGARSGNAQRTPESIAAALRALGGFGEIVTAYLEQPPYAADWTAAVRSRHVIAQPLLLSAGMHSSTDLPPLFGLRRAEDSPATHEGRQVWLRQGLGTDEELVTMILDQVESARS